MSALRRLLIANRGEIAIRIARAAAEQGITTIAVYGDEDSTSLHRWQADEAVPLQGRGAAAYLDIPQLVQVAREHEADALHPGYGFLSERADLAAALAAADIGFVGPAEQTLRMLGDKVAARRLAAEAGVPLLEGLTEATDLDGAREFFRRLQERGAAMMLKAVAGGGGRGVRVVEHADELEAAFRRCQSEAAASFGSGDLYCEEFLPQARHIEVQVVGDGEHVSHLWERDCSLQRRHQKIIEIAPAPALDETLRDAIVASALQLAAHLDYRNVGTFEFLVDTAAGRHAFIEANPRLQVEHTITEEITGVDLVATQLAIAAGRSLADLGLDAPPARPRGVAIQARINMERMRADGQVLPASGTLGLFAPPTGPGVRVDTFGYAGYGTSSAFDSLLAKVIAWHPAGHGAALRRLWRALDEFGIDGVATNRRFLQALLDHPAVAGADFHTRFVDAVLPDLTVQPEALRPHEASRPQEMPTSVAAPAEHRVGAEVDAADPLAVLSYGQQSASAAASAKTESGGPGMHLAPLQGTVVTQAVEVGDTVGIGDILVVLESMKMEHEVSAEVAGIVREVLAAVGDIVAEAAPLVRIEPADVDTATTRRQQAVDLDEIRPDLAEVLARHHKTTDAARPQVVAKRHDKGLRTARENIEDLCDAGSFVEYGPLVLAAQRRRRSIEELIDKTPADGMVTGIGTINSDLFEPPASECVVMSYDYTVLAGTQGGQNHRKTDRMISVAEQAGMPLVLFAEGGGGRPGDTDGIGSSETRTFARFATLSGLVPMIGITAGRCFAGNASLLGCCDVIIATADANIGMGGPAMIEGGGLGVFAPEEIGPMSVQVPNGVVDIAVADEAAAVAVARRYLSYFQGRTGDWTAPDQRHMRRIVPEHRLRVYEVRDVIDTLADEGSVLELRRGFGHGMVTSLIRIEGRPLGVVANNPRHLGGAIDADASDKAARFMQLCDAFDLPVLHLCDTPGIMVGPEIEHTALVRHSSRLFLTGANLTVPFFTIILRKAYGLGAIAMAGGSYKTPLFTVAWPTGEFGGMGLEGSVKLGYRNELAAIEDVQERKATFDRMVAAAYERGKALNEASLFGVDDTIDPADSRRWVARMLDSVRVAPRQGGKKRPAVDAW